VKRTLSPTLSLSTGRGRKTMKGRTMSEDWTRRDFLRTSAAVAAALAAGQHAFAAPATQQAHHKPQKLAVSTTQNKYSAVKVGFVGVHNKGGHNLHATAECGATVAALCDVDAEFLK